MCSQCDKECHFPGDAHGPLRRHKALWRLAPLEDMYSHTLQDDPSDRAQDSDGAGDGMLQWLRTGRPLLRTAWVYRTPPKLIKAQHKLLCAFVGVFIKCSDIAKCGKPETDRWSAWPFKARICVWGTRWEHRKYLSTNIWPVTCYFLLNEAVNWSAELTAKPGSCPTTDGLCPRSEDCEWDMDCPGWQKCCPQSGHFVCMDPTS